MWHVHFDLYSNRDLHIWWYTVCFTHAQTRTPDSIQVGKCRIVIRCFASKCDINRAFVCLKIADKIKEKRWAKNKTEMNFLQILIRLFGWVFSHLTDWLTKMLKSVFYKCLLSIEQLTHAHTHQAKQQRKNNNYNCVPLFKRLISDIFCWGFIYTTPSLFVWYCLGSVRMAWYYVPSPSSPEWMNQWMGEWMNEKHLLFVPHIENGVICRATNISIHLNRCE